MTQAGSASHAAVASEVCITGDTLWLMKSVSVRDLRNSGGDVLYRVEHGETVVVTRDGRPVAELRPLPRLSAGPAELIARRRHLPAVDPAALRADLDAFIEPGL
jgi:prevent-host-death family protein